jgi:4-diphosphocytidyl-2C-methyl-D-erythritol kinase
MVQNIRLEKEIKRLKRENKRFIEEINKLNDLIEQMKNIDDDELLMIEKIQTKEIYGKAQKLKISEIQKETEKIRIEIDRLKVVNNNKDRVLQKKDTEIIRIREELERVKKEKGKVVYKTEYKDKPETQRRIRDLEEQLRRGRNTTQIKTVI